MPRSGLCSEGYGTNREDKETSGLALLCERNELPLLELKNDALEMN